MNEFACGRESYRVGEIANSTDVVLSLGFWQLMDAVPCAPCIRVTHYEPASILA